MSKPSKKPKAGNPTPGRPTDYDQVLSGVVELLDTARRASARIVNTLMTATYWEIGRRVVEHEQAGQKRAGYGEEVVRKLSEDLSRRFGRGFGAAQVAAMRQFHLTFPLPDNFQSVIGKFEILQSTIGKSTPVAFERLNSVARALPLPWTHYVTCCACAIRARGNFMCAKPWQAVGQSVNSTGKSTRSFMSARHCQKIKPQCW